MLFSYIVDINLFDGIDNIVYGHLSEYPPQEICELATHFYIKDVDNVELSSIEVANEVVKLSGSGCLVVELQFGSHYDRRNGDSVDETVEFEFSFIIFGDKVPDDEKRNIFSHSVVSFVFFATGWFCIRKN